MIEDLMLEKTDAVAKGRVKIEMYDENNNVFFTKEKKNLVLLAANEITGQVYADPAKKVVAKHTDKGDSALNADAKGRYAFGLKHGALAEATFTTDVGSANTSEEIAIKDVINVVAIVAVKADGVDLVLDKDVWISNPETATLKFLVAPKNAVEITYRAVKSAYVSVVKGSQKVMVGTEEYTLSNTPSNTDKKYAIDYDLGIVYFETAKTGVVVEYKFYLAFSLGFMGLGTKPAGHPVSKPVEFADSDKLKVTMEGEFENDRQLIQYPAVVTKGEPEVEVFPYKPVAFTEKTLVVTGNGTAKEFTITGATNKILSITSSKEDLTGNDVAATLTGNKVVYATAPTSGLVINVKYREQLNNNHLIFDMADAPVLELIAVRHQDMNNTVKEYKIVDRGLTIGQGDVWIMNTAKGIVQFSTAPTGVDPLDPTKVPPVVETPGELTFEYRVNSGTTVQFVADFPGGVPGPMLVDKVGEVLNITSTVTTYNLQKPVAKDISGNFIAEVTLNGVKLVEGTGYDLSSDGKQVIFQVTLSDTDSCSVTYKYSEATHEIYQVAMFTEQEDGKMFNISGIGPVTKDSKTGMRVTWSVTF